MGDYSSLDKAIINVESPSPKPISDYNAKFSESSKSSVESDDEHKAMKTSVYDLSSKPLDLEYKDPFFKKRSSQE